jgi:subtilisin family serine protease
LIRAIAAVAVVVAAVGAGRAEAARFAVGVDPSALTTVASKLRAYGSVSRELQQLHVLVVDSSSARGIKRIAGVRYVEWVGSRRRRLSFTANDPLAPKQWYVPQDHAYDFWLEPPVLPPVKVAIVDSGIDVGHPDFAGRIALARSFVGGSVADTQGHGTFIAGEIAAALNNSEGIAGIAFPAQLLIAKVVRADGTISLEGEADAIRWAVDNGARVINLSLGGLRDPRNPSRDTYSALEASAVDYAAAHGVVIVAAVGNSDQAPVSPWPYATYPAALPHVIGVSALARDGSASSISNRDDVYNDIAAPGEDMFSTFPRSLTRAFPTCIDQGYSDCGPKEYRHAEGTSFAAPQVAAAAALVIAERPSLTSDQVSAIVERSADDANAANGCPRCPLLRDALTGWGRLDIAKALAVATRGVIPPPDRYETNDDAGTHAAPVPPTGGRLTATIDFWDDPIDVYSIRVAERTKLTATVAGTTGMSLELRLWSPQTRTVFGSVSRKLSIARSTQPGPRQRVGFTTPAGKGGRYFVEVRIVGPGSGPYTLTWARTPAT